MASYFARLEVEGQQYPVVVCTYSFAQATGARGRVSERVRHGLLELVLDVPDGDQLLRWATTPHQPFSGRISFYQASDLMARETVVFTDGECVHYQEIFEAGADLIGSYRCTLTIAARKLELATGGPLARTEAAGPGAALAAVAGSMATVASAATKAASLAGQVGIAVPGVGTVAGVAGKAASAAEAATTLLPKPALPL